MKYIILTGRVEKLSDIVNEYIENGWQLIGTPFRTGNKIKISGDLAYPSSCDWEAEIAQAMISAITLCR